MEILRSASRLADRAQLETRFAATLLHARGAGALKTPPHKLPGLLRDVSAFGPAGAALSLAALSDAARPAVVDEIGEITFGELEQRSNALANALLGKGFTAGDGLGVLCRNHRGLFEAIFAGARLGAQTLLLNTDFAGPQLADVCRREGVHALIHDEEFAAVAAAVDPPGGKYVGWTDGEPDPDNLGRLIDGADTARPPKPEHKQRIVLLTSGTTGTPKGAPRDMALSLALPAGYLSKIPLRSGRTVILAAPAFHAWGLLSSIIALGLGNTLVIARKTPPTWMLDTLEHSAADALITVPILLSRLMELDAEIRTRRLGSLRVVAVSGSALSSDLATRTMDLLGEVLYNLYGSTEVAYATIATPEDLRAAPGTVGRPPTGTTVSLLDEDGNEVPTGEPGRIFVGSTMQFEGYTGGGTKEVVDGLMSTGDIGHVDGEGRLFVDGRDDDMIVSGGENVFPAEVEELLASFDGVLEAAVIGVDDETYGKRLRGYVVLADGASVDEQALKNHVKSSLARYKVPREIVFIDELPRNPAGKVMKRNLPEPD